MLFKKIVIVGVGLIGASLGRAIKENNIAGEVIGIVHHKETIDKAIEAKAIDKGSLDFDSLKDADLVIFATPVEAIIDLTSKIKNLLPKDCLVIDVGSTKEQIVKTFDNVLPKNIQFLGCHPLAGLEKKGLEFSRSDLFKNSLVILTPLKKRICEANLEKVKNFWQLLGCKVEVMPSSLHDKIIAYTSDLPHILAFSLLNTLPKNYTKFIATGFRDTTRIGASDPEMWNDILISNQKQVLGALKNWQKKIDELKKLIELKKQEKLKNYILAAKNTRQKI